MRGTYRFGLAGAAVALAAQAPAGEAQPAPTRELLQPPKVVIASPITDRFAIRGLYFRPNITSQARNDASETDLGTLFSPEDDTGLPDTKGAGSLDLMFRMGERHRIHANYYQQVRHGSQVLAGEIQFGEESYFQDEQVSSSMDLRRLEVSYTYSLLKRERIEFGLGRGLQMVQISGSLESEDRFVKDELSISGPFPVAVADVSWRVLRRLSLNGSFHWIDAKADEFDAYYSSWSADLQYRLKSNVALGLGYSAIHYRMESEDSEDFTGYFSLKYQGPLAFVRVSF
jgi:hypothetical protein